MACQPCPLRRLRGTASAWLGIPLRRQKTHAFLRLSLIKYFSACAVYFTRRTRTAPQVSLRMTRSETQRSP